MSKTVANPETHVGEHITLLTYASLDDIGRSIGVTADPCSVQTYANLTRKTTDRCVGVKSRAAYNTEAKQLLAAILSMMVDELDSAGLEDGDSIEVIRKKSVEAGGTITDFVFKTAGECASKLGQTLLAASDQKKWVKGILDSRTPTIAASIQLTTVISIGFEGFLKALAWMMAQSLPYIAPRTSIGHGPLLVTMAQLGLGHLVCEDLKSSVKVRAPAKRKPAKAKADAVATEVDPDADVDGDVEDEIADV